MYCSYICVRVWGRGGDEQIEAKTILRAVPTVDFKYVSTLLSTFRPRVLLNSRIRLELSFWTNLNSISHPPPHRPGYYVLTIFSYIPCIRYDFSLTAMFTIELHPGKSFVFKSLFLIFRLLVGFNLYMYRLYGEVYRWYLI